MHNAQPTVRKMRTRSPSRLVGRAEMMCCSLVDQVKSRSLQLSCVACSWIHFAWCRTTTTTPTTDPSSTNLIAPSISGSCHKTQLTCPSTSYPEACKVRTIALVRELSGPIIRPRTPRSLALNAPGNASRVNLALRVGCLIGWTSLQLPGG